MAPEIPGLRTWRERRGVTLDAISASTKLSITQLAAIECGDFARLPGGIYTTNYIRQYARAIAFDENELLDFYRSSFPEPARQDSPKVRHSDKPGHLLFQH
ncbi:MAG: helix-turn-helix transcriptional regulator [Terriglobia bacterium]